MKAPVLVLLLMVLVSMASAIIDGRIKEVSGGISGESEPIAVKSLVIIENTGDQRTRYHIVLAVDRDGN
jgi:hypothetical protein